MVLVFFGGGKYICLIMCNSDLAFTVAAPYRRCALANTLAEPCCCSTELELHEMSLSKLTPSSSCDALKPMCKSSHIFLLEGSEGASTTLFKSWRFRPMSP